MLELIKDQPILLEGVHNCREYGGYKVKDGRIKHQKLIRGADLSKMTSYDKQVLSRFPVRKIIDLRTQAEVEMHPDQSVEDSEFVHLDVMKQIVSKENASPVAMIKMLGGRSVADMMNGIYHAFVAELSCRDVYKRFFAEILEQKEGAVYFHCTAGKDRTGFGGALVLTALGADRDLVMEDYLLSNPYREKENEKALARIMQAVPDKKPQDVLAILQVKADYLNTAFRAMDELYGGADRFLEDGLNITRAQKEKLQVLFVE